MCVIYNSLFIYAQRSQARTLVYAVQHVLHSVSNRRHFSALVLYSLTVQCSTMHLEAEPTPKSKHAGAEH